MGIIMNKYLNKISKKIDKKENKFSYIAVADKIKEYINLAYDPDNDIKIPPEDVLSEYFNVSRVTIRRALKDLIEENIIYSIHGSGNFARRKLDTKIVKKKIGLLAFQQDFHMHPATSELLKGIYQVFEILDIELDIYYITHEETLSYSFYKKLKENNIAGLIVLEFEHSYILNLQKILKDIPIILRDELSPIHIAVDTPYLGKYATDYLHSKGHSYIALVTVDAMSITTSHLISGMDLDKINLAIYSFEYKLNTQDFLSFLEKHPEITAIIAYDDYNAINIINILKSKGLSCPEDMSILSLANHGTGEKYKISGFIQPRKKLGAALARGILDIINNKKIYSKNLKSEFLELDTIKDITKK